MRRSLLAAAVVGILAGTALTGGGPAQAGAPAGSARTGGSGAGGDDAVLHRYATDTWASFAAMTYPESGLPADSLGDDGTRSVQTSTTNIGAYLWSAVTAHRLGIIGRRELVGRVSTTLGTLERLERAQGGQFYNWYDARTGAKLTTWPPTGAAITPILSSVDNAWLATGLRVVRGAVPQVAARAGKLYDSMDFGVFYRADVNRILFHIAPDTGEAPCCYDMVVSESRMASYLGIANRQLPPETYYGTHRAFPATCEFAFQEAKPAGPTRTYLGQRVFEGSYAYAGMRIVPSWGGSAFEALMPALFLPEETWAPRSWGVNHPNTVRAQIHHGLVEAGYGYWGFSPSNNPAGGYATYGVDAVGADPGGYPSNNDATLVDRGFAGCPDRPAVADPPPSAYTNGVVTPHAAFLALRYDRRAALDNLAKLRRDFDVYSGWGFRDAVNVGTGQVSPAYLSLDQGMIMAAIGNELTRDGLRRAFGGRDTEALRPLIGQEAFSATPPRR
jgi:hypothetical protein